MKRVYLEITNSCNLDCPFCTVNKGKGFMDIEDFNNYTDQIRPYCEYIYLHVLGEPLLHPLLDDFLNILDEKGFKLQLVTNGTLLSGYPDILDHECLRKLSISVHSVNGLSIDDAYFDVINELIEKERKTVIELRFYDKERLDPGLKDYLSYLTDKYGLKETKREDSFLLKENTYVYFEELFKWPDLSGPFISDKGKCHGFSDQIAILCDGRVTGCCLDARGVNVFGDLKKDTLADILNGDKYLKYLEDMRNGILSPKLCRHCSYRTRFS